MAPCRLHKKRTVLLFAVAVVSLLIACKSADEEAGPRGGLSETATGGPTVAPPTVVAVSPSPGSFPSPPPPEASQVQVIVTKDVYEVGEDIPYTIINHWDRPIYYRYSGCDFPWIVQWVNDEEVTLVTNVLDVFPEIKEIEPGGSLTCVWDQTFYPTRGTHRELQDHPTQVRFLYAFNETDVDEISASHTASSEEFTID